MRTCQKQTCGEPAAAVVAVRYATKEIVVTALSAESDRRMLELCEGHAARLTPPYGWATRDERRASAPARPTYADGLFAPDDPYASAV